MVSMNGQKQNLLSLSFQPIPLASINIYLEGNNSLRNNCLLQEHEKRITEVQNVND